jgi:hypothetical protein
LQTWLFFIPTPLFFLAATSSFFSSLLFVRTQSPFHGQPPFLPTAAAGRPSSLACRKLPHCPWRPPLPPCFMGVAPSLICCSRHGGQSVGAAGVGCSCCAKVASLHSAPWTAAAHQRRALPMAPPPASSPLHQRPSLLRFFSLLSAAGSHGARLCSLRGMLCSPGLEIRGRASPIHGAAAPPSAPPLEQQPRQLRSLAAPCFAQSSGQHHPSLHFG